MEEESVLCQSSKQQMIIRREYIGTQTVVSVCPDYLRVIFGRRLPRRNTFDNEGLSRLECTQWNMKTLGQIWRFYSMAVNKNGEQDL